jgi:hypothetical protein
MTRSTMIAGLLVVSTVACATPRPGARLTESNPNIQAQVEFDHGCAPERVRFIRYDKSRVTADLDVRRRSAIQGLRDGVTGRCRDVAGRHHALSGRRAPRPVAAAWEVTNRARPGTADAPLD